MNKIATFGFDDGGPADFAVRDIFRERGLVPTSYLIGAMLNNSEMIYGMPRADLAAAYEGVEIGAHTMSHPHLSGCAGGRTRREIGDCKDLIAELFGRTPTLFAAPFGSYAAHTRPILEDLGFEWGRGIQRDFDARAHQRLKMPISVMFYNEAEEELLKRRMGLGAPIYILGHSWWIDRMDLWDELRAWVDLLLGKGYRIIPNSEFYKETRYE